MPDRPTLYLIRHGETTWNRVGRRQGSLPQSPLTLLGTAQARAAGERLKSEIADWDAVPMVCSPLYRCRQTAALICDQIGLDVERITYDKRIRERDWGRWEGHLDQEVRVLFPEDWAQREADKWGFAFPGGENYPMLEERISAWLSEQDPERTMVVVSHGEAGRIFRRLYLGTTPEETADLPVPQDAVFRLSGTASEQLPTDPSAFL